MYSRWGAFYKNIEKCIHGVKVKSKEELFNALMWLIGLVLMLIFLTMIIFPEIALVGIIIKLFTTCTIFTIPFIPTK